MSKLSMLDLIVIQRACEQSVVNFSTHFDAREYSSMAEYFATQGVWLRADGVITGLDELQEKMKQRPDTLFVRHVLTNFRTTVIDEMHAVVESYVTVYRCDFYESPQIPARLDCPDLVGRYHDEMILESGRWKIARRSVQVDFKR